MLVLKDFVQRHKMILAICQRCRCPVRMSGRVLRENVRWNCADLLIGYSVWESG